MGNSLGQLLPSPGWPVKTKMRKISGQQKWVSEAPKQAEYNHKDAEVSFHEF